jgi:hypothetical protein
MSITINVPMVLARNPVARAVERANLRRWFTATALQVQSMADGAPGGSLLIGLAEALGMACKAAEGFDDPQDVRGTLTEAMGRLVAMTDGGSRWDQAHAEPLCDALDIAVQLLAVSSPEDKLKAWAWCQAAAGNRVAA